MADSLKALKPILKIYSGSCYINVLIKLLSLFIVPRWDFIKTAFADYSNWSICNVFFGIIGGKYSFIGIITIWE